MSSPKIDHTGFKVRYIPQKTFDLQLETYNRPKGTDLFNRCHQLINYVGSQREAQIWLYNRKMLTGVNVQVLAVDQYSNVIHVVNFGSADYLGLAQSELAKQAAVEATQQVGISSGGGPRTTGINKFTAQLEQQLKEYWHIQNILIFSAGWLAGFGVLKGLIEPQDHIIIDRLGHNCLQEGAKAATKNIHKTAHLDNQDVLKTILEIRAKDKEGAILVVTEGLFSMDSDSPDLNQLQKICKANGCYLLIDCAHDFGCMGPTGRGVWEMQNLRDRSNVILLGTGSKTLSTNIGFVGCQNKTMIQYLRGTCCTYLNTTGINPVQAATSLANLRILKGQEGKTRRTKVLENYHFLRKKLQETGNKIFGQPCPILPLFVGNEFVCRMVARLMLDDGINVNGIQFPVVSIGQARLRVNLMPQHSHGQLQEFVSKFNSAKKRAEVIVQESLQIYQKSLQDKESKDKSKL